MSMQLCLFPKYKVFLMFQKKYVYAHVFLCVQKYLQRPEEGVGFPGAGITSGCKPPGLGAWNGAWILC